jgi:hypothetical protein
MIDGGSGATRWALAALMGIGLMSLGGTCGNSSSNDDAGTADAGGGNHDAASDAPLDAPVEGATVAATCAGVCQCLAAACPDYPFQPDCMTACMDPTNNPAWDLACRAAECSAAYANHDAHCPNASGQTMCH